MENEFEYFDSKTLENWAGPNHWKFRALKDGNEVQAKKKTKSKKVCGACQLNELGALLYQF